MEKYWDHLSGKLPKSLPSLKKETRPYAMVVLNAKIGVAKPRSYVLS